MDISYSGMIGPRLRKEMPEGVEQLRVLPRRSWKMVGVAVLFTFLEFGKHPQGLVNVLRGRVDGWGDRFYLIMFALVWVAALIAFVGEFFGSEVWRIHHGELLVRRGVGPLHRVFRFRTDAILELAASDPTDSKGKRRLHHILFKPKEGAVRFVCNNQEFCFADWLEAAEGEVIVRWLRPRLPKRATEFPQYESGGGTANLTL